MQFSKSDWDDIVKQRAEMGLTLRPVTDVKPIETEQPTQSMKTFVVSLPNREDRRELFHKNNSKHLSGYQFHDAFDGREHTYKQITEQGMGHK